MESGRISIYFFKSMRHHLLHLRQEWGSSQMIEINEGAHHTSNATGVCYTIKNALRQSSQGIKALVEILMNLSNG
jgi:hypothetical protein